MEENMNYEVEQNTEVAESTPIELEVSEKKNPAGAILGGAALGAVVTILGMKAVKFVKKKIAARKEAKNETEETEDTEK